jgi:hypothetical protein
MSKPIINIAFLIIICFYASCKPNNEPINATTLEAYLSGKSFEKEGVIACSASEEDTKKVFTFFYPYSDAKEMRLYETEALTADFSDYSQYELVDMDSEPVFNGYLRRFVIEPTAEKWAIVTFEVDNEIKISNPIRYKQLTKPTIWNESVIIENDGSLEPRFTWEKNAVGDNAIYFEVISKENNDLVSGTYTYENQFQFYDTTNVVLNITTQVPQLESNANYNFTLMDVSLDNWVNLVSTKKFRTP